MPIKKFISSQSLQPNINNFRSLLGQYWFIDALGNLRYNVDTELEGGPVPTGLVGPTVEVTYSPINSFEADRTLLINRVHLPSDPAVNEYEGIWTGYAYANLGVGLDSAGVGLVRNRSTGGVDLYLRVQGTNDQYPFISTFDNDLKEIFKNYTLGGAESPWQETSFTSEYYGRNDLIDEEPAIKIHSSYNFFSEEYERTLATTPESSIPNGYALLSYADYSKDFGVGAGGEIDFSEDIKTHVLLDSTIAAKRRLFTVPFGEGALDGPERVFTDDPLLSYVREWTSQYSGLSLDRRQKVESIGKNIILTKRTLIQRIQNREAYPFSFIGSRKQKLPFFIEIDAPAEPVSTITDPTSSEVQFGGLELDFVDNISDILGNMTTIWTSYLASANDPGVNLTSTQNEVYGLKNLEYFITNRGSSELSDTNTVTLQGSSVLNRNLERDKTLDASYTPEAGPTSTNSIATLAYHAVNGGDYFDTGVIESPSPLFDTSRKLILGGPSEEKQHALSLGESTVSDLLETELELQARLVDQFAVMHFNVFNKASNSQTAAMESFLSFTNEKYSGARAYEEAFEDEFGAARSFTHTICYGIDKYRGDKETGEYVQTIWIPNVPGEDRINYVDSQVRYGEKYTYDAYAYKYVFGMGYSYERTKEPKQIEAVPITGGGASPLGYLVYWDGARNLFDKIDGVYAWSVVATQANTVSYPYGHLALFDSLYRTDPPDFGSIFGAAVAAASGADCYASRNSHYFTFAELNNLFEIAWRTNPTGPDGTFYQSWDDIWSDYTWGEDGLVIDADTPMGGGDLDIALDEDLGSKDPRNFSILQWFKLFFGAADSQHFSFGDELNASGAGVYGYDLKKTYQGYPPSHHVFAARYVDLIGAGSLLADVVSTRLEVIGGTREKDAGIATGFAKVHSNLLRGWRLAVAPDGTTTLRGPVGDLITGVSVTYGTLPPGASGESAAGTVGELELEDTILTESTGFQAQYKIMMKPSTRIIKVPYFQRTGVVLSSPPPPPEVEITPYRAVNNNLLFSFVGTNTKVVALPIAIEPEEEELFNSYYDAQGVLPGSGVTFEADDVVDKFQVYRIDFPPTSYSDFAGNERASISTVVSDGDTVKRAAAATYVERLQPNTKYYYTFRSLDFHENPSNPTIVYEVELVDDGGAVYPLIKTYEFPIVDDRVNFVGMKKLIQVIPSLNQVTANVDTNTHLEGIEIPTPSSDNLPNVELGSEDLIDPIWDKTFKIRLTSKQTGKKIDFNLTMAKRDDRTKPS